MPRLTNSLPSKKELARMRRERAIHKVVVILTRPNKPENVKELATQLVDAVLEED